MSSKSGPSFFKFVSLAAARAILPSGTFRWSAPSIFNDPFDMQFSFRDAVTLDQFKRQFSSHLKAMTFGENKPSFKENERGGMLLNRLWQQRSAPGARELFHSKILPLMLWEAARTRFPHRNTDFLNVLRIFCISESAESILQWSHYADCHRGLVLGIAPAPGGLIGLDQARRVIYQDEYPHPPSLAQLVDHVTGRCRIPMGYMDDAVLLTKSVAWSYEKEWRCISLCRMPDRKFEDRPFRPAELRAVYLGCRTAPEDRAFVTAILEEDRYSHVEIFQGRKRDTCFGLEFERVRCRRPPPPSRKRR